MSNCELCNKLEDERSLQEQAGFYICLSCDGMYDDEELKFLIKHGRKNESISSV